MKFTGIILGGALLIIGNHCGAQETRLMSELLDRIDQLQAKESSVFPKGIFPSYRMYALNKDREKADVNIFFTGLIAMTLKDLQPKLTPAQQQQAAAIIEKTKPVYPKFQNQKGRNTYNFWTTDTPRIFPNAGWMNLMDKSQSLPDDLDDTVIMLLAMDAPNGMAQQVHALMQQFTNNGEKRVRNTFKDYQHIGAYSTWFGKKMPVDFDVCVLANVLFFVQRYNLPWTAADSASLQLIEKVITEKKHIDAAAYVSPHYNRTPVILYHLSRLMSVKPIPTLEKFRPQLISETRDALAHTHQFMDQIILSTALLRWGVHPIEKKIQTTKNFESLLEENSFHFFIGDIATRLPDPYKKWLIKTGLGKFYYDCPAYNNLLLLEYLALQIK